MVLVIGPTSNDDDENKIRQLKNLGVSEMNARALLPPAPPPPTNFAQLIKPAPLASKRNVFFLSTSRLLNFTIILNDARTSISVKKSQIF